MITSLFINSISQNFCGNNVIEYTPIFVNCWMSNYEAVRYFEFKVFQFNIYISQLLQIIKHEIQWILTSNNFTILKQSKILVRSQTLIVFI